MAFGGSRAKEIRRDSGYYCAICGEWHPPRKHELRPELDAHSLDRTHRDMGMPVCSASLKGKASCHQRLHDTTNDPAELRKVSLTAAELGGLAEAIRMVNGGVPENIIRRRLLRRGY